MEMCEPLGVLRAEWRFQGARLRLKAAAAELNLRKWEKDDALMQARVKASEWEIAAPAIAARLNGASKRQ